MGAVVISLHQGNELVLERDGQEVGILRLRKGAANAHLVVVADADLRIGRRPLSDPKMDDYDHERLLAWADTARRRGWTGAKRAAELLGAMSDQAGGES